MNEFLCRCHLFFLKNDHYRGFGTVLPGACFKANTHPVYLRGLASKTMNPQAICTRPTCNFMGPTVKVLINADAIDSQNALLVLVGG